VIVGCDGLWKSFSNDEVTKFVNSIAENEKETTSSQKHNVYDICATRMANAAVKKLTADNVTVMLLSIHHQD
jgi:integrin-linked kinase-associated serine/threonine phosphatase 2C